MRKFTNPKTFWGRFLVNVALFSTMWPVMALIAWLVGRWDLFTAVVSPLALIVSISLGRAGIARPGTSVWASPFQDKKK
ncbi:hypothetical protein [Raineyella sp.]|uniref:hypothetical protein n=1 Tax=Raineyella sp. TaxID=1911550 RepID=UPI002B204D28|nr:hypothetical protein [Raineyella sp.]MEA5155834.1 hypothetical protein [Raineyella sp.]